GHGGHHPPRRNARDRGRSPALSPAGSPGQDPDRKEPLRLRLDRSAAPDRPHRGGARSGSQSDRPRPCDRPASGRRAHGGRRSPQRRSRSRRPGGGPGDHKAPRQGGPGDRGLPFRGHSALTAAEILRPVYREGRSIRMLDQRLLPGEEVWLTLEKPSEIALAIREMVVRGAPSIGVAAAYGAAFAMRSGASTPPAERFETARRVLAATRPTAV